LRRFAYGKNTKQNSVNFDEDQIEKSELSNPSNLSYPMPTPRFGGYNIDKVCLFIGGVFILGNLNLRSH
jgi:hypothetical protein